MGVIALSTVTVEPWTLEGDGGRGPDPIHRIVAICTHRRDDLCVDRLLDLSGATTVTLESINHSFTASSIAKNPTDLSTLRLLANSEVAGIRCIPHSGSGRSSRSKE